MNSDKTGFKEELSEFRKLINQVRLYEFNDWVDKGKPIRCLHGKYKQSPATLKEIIRTPRMKKKFDTFGRKLYEQISKS